MLVEINTSVLFQKFLRLHLWLCVIYLMIVSMFVLILGLTGPETIINSQILAVLYGWSGLVCATRLGRLL